MMTKRLLILVPGVLALAGAPVRAADTPADAQAFMQDAASGGKAEVQLGTLAQDQGASPDVKQFGARMVSDHSKANAELQALAAKKGVELPADVEQKDQELHDRLAALSGPEFDRAYMNAMVQDHDHDVAAFEKAAASTDADVKTFAAKTLPTLEQHQSEARRIQSSLATPASPADDTTAR